MRYLAGGQYASLKELARANYDRNQILAERYGSFENMVRDLQLPEQLSASLDLATGTGKSFVLFGIAMIMLAEGMVDAVLVLCPSTTIERGLTEKFRELATNKDLIALLPDGASVKVPSIINASESIVSASICVENYHAILDHVRSSVHALWGKGSRVLVLNDEAHHVANGKEAREGKWKAFLTNPAYGFRYVLGVSGTCYVENDYFSDVIFRYSLKQAMSDRFVKRVHYVVETPQTNDPDEKWQLIKSKHDEAVEKLANRGILPLTIVVTQTISRCQDVAEELRAFLVEHSKISAQEARNKVLAIYSGSSDLAKLPYIESSQSSVEWVVSVSMLNEGWDVKRVFQIVPHEERAFNSKLLISQTLGRGLRIPVGWSGQHPVVSVFNHEAWALRIQQLVNEILEVDRRVTSAIIQSSPYHFTLHNATYEQEAVSVKKPMEGPYKLFEKGYVDLPTTLAEEQVGVEYRRTESDDAYTWNTTLRRKTYTPHQVSRRMYERLVEADEVEAEAGSSQRYTDDFPLERLTGIVRESLSRVGMENATEEAQQKFLQSLGTLRRRTSENVRYVQKANPLYELTTLERPRDSASIDELKQDRTLFWSEISRSAVAEDELEVFDEVIEEGAGFKVVAVGNTYRLKAPLNFVLTDFDPERKFVSLLTSTDNSPHLDAWIKSTTKGFYEIAYAWKKGEHQKRAKFSPDFFLKVGDLIIVVEIKGNEEVREPSEENRQKNRFAVEHFRYVNDQLSARNDPTRYSFHFLTPSGFNAFFQSLREGHVATFRSELDVKLADDGSGVV